MYWLATFFSACSALRNLALTFGELAFAAGDASLSDFCLSEFCATAAGARVAPHRTAARANVSNLFISPPFRAGSRVCESYRPACQSGGTSDFAKVNDPEASTVCCELSLEEGRAVRLHPSLRFQRAAAAGTRRDAARTTARTVMRFSKSGATSSAADVRPRSLFSEARALMHAVTRGARAVSRWDTSRVLR